MKSEVLTTYPSRSNPSKEYHIIRGGDGVTYCDCPAWRFNTDRTCKHLEDYLMGQTTYKVRKGKDEKGKVATYLDLEAAISKAVSELS